MEPHLPGLDVEDFLARRWQREPVLIRGALTDFEWPLDANDLAGLACEEQVEARIITGPDDRDGWTLEHGPFDEEIFEAIGDQRWSLLVQDVEKHYPPLARLLEHFRFLPRWRIDDLMLSFAAPGGSVGPHVDQYDVFLCQVEGRRRWEVAETFAPGKREDVPVDMLADFRPEQRWDLEPGDVLYLPPGVAHHGVALEPCVTCSVGFRAPSAADLALGLGEWLAGRPGDGGRYRDPPLTANRACGEIEPSDLEGFRQLLTAVTTEPGDFAAFVGQFISRFRQAHEPLPIPGDTAQAALEAALAASKRMPTHWVAHPWARWAWVRGAGDTARLFASGREYVCTPGFAAWVCGGAGRIDPPNDRDRKCLADLARQGQLIPDNH
jgi:50S ribosomal protein L16 3-hydroxylase